ncbi:MAG: glycosyltransferase family 4 protein [Candidatus Korobacteraceae bacterium]
MFFVSIFCFATALVLAFVLTWVVRDRAVASGMVTLPASLRHIHTAAVPRIGGVAIYVSIATTGAVLYLISQFWPLPVVVDWYDLLIIFLAATPIFLLGLYDDMRGVGPYTKFAVQGAVAVLVYLAGFRIVNLPILFGKTDFGWIISLALTVFWILWITNAFNLIDGVDGLAAGSALFSTVVVFIASMLNTNGPGLVVTAVLSGALLGFLRFNFNPATIFLGDSGSLLVGFMLGAIALHGQKSPTMVAVAIPVVSCGLPILETMLSVMRRFLSGKPIFTADREHIHHKLLNLGLSQRQVAFVLYGVSAVFGLMSLVLLLPGGGPVALVIVVLGGILWLGVQHLGYHEFFELRRVAQRTIEQKQVIINNLAIRRGMEKLADCHDLEQFQSVLMSIFEGNDFDGFELRYGLLADRFYPGAAGPHTFSFRWDKGGETAQAVWAISMDLSGAGAEGTLRLLRRRYHRPLKVDVNLLDGEFVRALQVCLRRVLEQRVRDAEAISDPHVLAQMPGVRAQSVGTA